MCRDGLKSEEDVEWAVTAVPGVRLQESPMEESVNESMKCAKELDQEEYWVNNLRMETGVPRGMENEATDPHARFLDIVLRNESVRMVTDRLAELDLPDSYLAAGCLCQTVWNHVSGFPLDHGIADYDVLYCDLDDLTWEGEDRVIRRCAAAFEGLGVEVQVRNQARVHLWYPEKFGVPHPALQSTKEGIDNFLHRCSSLGLRKTPDGYDVYAPFGFDDVFGMFVRPNYMYDLPERYEQKAARWRQTWPGVAVEKWHSVDTMSSNN